MFVNKIDTSMGLVSLDNTFLKESASLAFMEVWDTPMQQIKPSEMLQAIQSDNRLKEEMIQISHELFDCMNNPSSEYENFKNIYEKIAGNTEFHQFFKKTYKTSLYMYMFDRYFSINEGPHLEYEKVFSLMHSRGENPNKYIPKIIEKYVKKDVFLFSDPNPVVLMYLSSIAKNHQIDWSMRVCCSCNQPFISRGDEQGITDYSGSLLMYVLDCLAYYREEPVNIFSFDPNKLSEYRNEADKDVLEGLSDLKNCYAERSDILINHLSLTKEKIEKDLPKALGDRFVNGKFTGFVDYMDYLFTKTLFNSLVSNIKHHEKNTLVRIQVFKEVYLPLFKEIGFTISESMVKKYECLSDLFKSLLERGDLEKFKASHADRLDFSIDLSSYDFSSNADAKYTALELVEILKNQ